MPLLRQTESAYAAKRFLVDRASKVTIARELGMSRFRVARLIDEAYENGLVDVKISMPGGVDWELSSAIQEQFGLASASVVQVTAQDAKTVRRALGPVAAQVLRDELRDGDLLGVSVGRSMLDVALSARGLPHCDVVQLTGIAAPNLASGQAIPDIMARASGGSAHLLKSPLTLPDPTIAAAMRNRPINRRSLAKLDHLDIAIVTIGSWDPPQSQLFETLADEELRRRILQTGVLGEVGATLFLGDGRLSEDLAPVAIAVSVAQLARARSVIAVAGGPGKARAIRAALLSNMVSSLVTDGPTARELLRQPLT